MGSPGFKSKVVVVNGKRVTAAFRNFPRYIGQGIDDAVENAGLFVAGETRRHVSSGYFKHPTGRLKNSIRSKTKGSGKNASGIVTASVKYAVFVHEGHRDRGGGMVQAKPFFKEVIKDQMVIDRIERFFTGEMQNACNKVSRSV